MGLGLRKKTRARVLYLRSRLLDLSEVREQRNYLRRLIPSAQTLASPSDDNLPTQAKVVIVTSINLSSLKAGSASRISEVVQEWARRFQVDFFLLGSMTDDNHASLSKSLSPAVVFYSEQFLGHRPPKLSPHATPFDSAVIEHRRAFSRYYRSRKPRVVMIEYLRLYSLLEGYFGDSVRICDLHDVHWQRYEALRSVGLPLPEGKIRKSDERSRMEALDAVIAISSDDAAALRKETDAHILEFSYTASSLELPPPPFVDSSRLIFVGGVQDFNLLALQWFCHYVLPRLDKSIELYIYGTIGDRKKNLHLDPALSHRIVWIGEYKSSNEPYLRPGIVISPLLAGSGFHIKTAEALKAGLPIVGSLEAFRGLHTSLGLEISPPLWVERIKDLQSRPAMQRYLSEQKQMFREFCDAQDEKRAEAFGWVEAEVERKGPSAG